MRIWRERSAGPRVPSPLRIMAWSGIAFLHIPIVLVAIYATALLAGGILAFGLSFDELTVTTFTAGHARRQSRHLRAPRPQGSSAGP